MLLAGFLCLFVSFWGSLPAAYALGGVPRENSNTSDVTNSNTAEDAFNNEARQFAEGYARLGDELATLPGPKVSFDGFARALITWAAGLAGSVALFLLVWKAFKSISGTEEAHNDFKRVILQILIGLTMIFFSFAIVNFVMSLIWAGS